MPFPHGPGIRVTVQRSKESAYWSVIPGGPKLIGPRRVGKDTIWVDPPWRRPCLPGNRNPRFGATEVGLNICLFGIGLLDVMSGKTTIAIRVLAGLHGTWRRAEVLKDCGVVLLRADIVALEHNSIFELSMFAIVIQLMAFLDHDANKSAHVDDALIKSSTSGNVLPLTNRGLVSDVLVS